MIEKEQLLAEIEDVLRTMPPPGTLRHQTQENYAWLGRLSALIEAWSPTKGRLVANALTQLRGTTAQDVSQGFGSMMTILHQARHDLRMQTVGPLSISIQHRMVFDYFDEIRKMIEEAKQDILFGDPYLDTEFVSRYLEHIAVGVTTRLLTREKLSTLLPAVDLFIQQSKKKVEVRSAPNFHDRYIFIDKSTCYQSGASFKDGAKSSPTTLTQITDAFSAVSKTYEDMWGIGKVER